MRYLRLFCATATLICAFTFSAYAGVIECPAVVDPPPPPTATATGDAPCPGLTQFAESLIQSVLSLS
jgi:hypothetical protein